MADARKYTILNVNFENSSSCVADRLFIVYTDQIEGLWAWRFSSLTSMPTPQPPPFDVGSLASFSPHHPKHWHYCVEASSLLDLLPRDASSRSEIASR